MKLSDRFSSTLGVAMVAAGTLLFFVGGAQHPHINSSLGVLGSAEFYDNFAMHVAHHRTWAQIHAMILAGPLLWVLGLALLESKQSETRDDALSRLASKALTLFAAGWAVTFIFDGFLSPMIVRAFPPDVAKVQIQVTAEVVIRLGMVSWLLLAIAILALSLRTLGRNISVGQWLIGGLGLFLGIWPFVAWINGSFRPGPFTSPYWNITAITTAVWFVLLAVHEARKAVPTRVATT